VTTGDCSGSSKGSPGSSIPSAAMTAESKHKARSSNRTLVAAVAALAGTLAFLTYVRTLAPGLLAGDSAEFQFAAFQAGVAHPTGYPLYLMLGWVWSHLLMIRDVAWRMNLFSALWGGATVGLVCVLAEQLLSRTLPSLRLSSRLPAAAAASLTFAWSPIFWSSSVVAEIYTLHTTIVVVLMVLALRWEGGRSRPSHEASPAKCQLGSLFGLVTVFGLGLTHHSTTVLLAPALLIFVAWTLRSHRTDTGLPWSRVALQVLQLAALLCVPMLLYLYLPIRAPHTDYLWVNLSENRVLGLYDLTVRGFFRYISGRVFAGSLLSVGQAASRVGLAWSHLLGQLTWSGVALAILGLLQMAVSRRWRLLTLTGLSFLSLMVFNLFYGIGDIHVLFSAPALLACCWVGVGIGAVAAFASRILRRRADWARRSAMLIPFVSMALAATMLVSNWPTVDQSPESSWDDRWRALLDASPAEDAILISNDRDEIMPLWYLQQIEKARPDLTGLFPLIVEDAGWGDVGQVIDQALMVDRPVFLIKPMPGLEVKYNLRTEGPLVEVLGRSVSEGPQGDAVGDVGVLMRLLEIDVPPFGEASSVLDVQLYWQPKAVPKADYTSFVHLLDGSGEKIAQSDHLPGGLYYPTSLWRTDEVLRDHHRLSLPNSLGAGPHTLLVGFYSQPSMEQLGEPIHLLVPELDSP